MTGPVAILCSGQGTQHRDMFALTGTVADAEPIFAAATPHLGGTDPRAFVRDAADDALFANHAGQILCCTQALAAWALLGDARPDRAVLAGYSVGELAAWGLAGLLPSGDLLDLAAARAAAMDRAAPAGAALLAVSGPRRAELEALLPAGAAIAIGNAPDSFVVGGPDAALAELERHPGLRCRRLRVAVPSHTPSMRDAAASFAETLSARSWPRLPSAVRLLGGTTADLVRDPATGAAALAAQIAGEIRWSDCLRACAEQGASVFLELGPGAALSRGAEAALPGIEARALDQFRTADGLRDWLRRRVDAS